MKSVKRWLVVTRGPGGRLHFDIVLASSDAHAADRVREMRTRGNVGETGRGSYPVVLSTENVLDIASAMWGKGDEEIEKKFQSLKMKGK